MSVETIREVLGRLQEDPHSENDWESLYDVVTAPADGAVYDNDLDRLLELARARHESRRDWSAVARLLEMELSLMPSGEVEAAMQAELARVYQEELFDSKRATAAYQRLLKLRPTDAAAREHVDADETRRGRWRDLYDRYLSEAEGSTEESFKSVLLTSAGDVAYRYGGDAIDRAEIVRLVDEALQLDTKNRRAAALSEVLALETSDFKRAANAAALALRATGAKDERVAAGLRAGRLYARKLGDAKRAVAVYQEVVDLSPGQSEALAYLAETFSKSEEWDHLVALYEDQLKSGLKGEAEQGIVVQLAMVHWRMRGEPDAAEPWFERIRRVEPTHQGMLAFFRDHLGAKKETGRLLTILTDAQRAMPAGPARNELSGDIARLAETVSDASRAVEQYRALLRQDPGNAEARDALRRLYQQTENHQGLLDLARQQLDRLPADSPERAPILREMAELHGAVVARDPGGRDAQKHEQARVAVLLQLAQLDEADVDSLREIVKTYESLGRWRDLLAYQQKLAERTPDEAEKASIHRASARRWLDQFSNVQNAIASYEGLLEVRPGDEEAVEKLRDLYQKRRAWPALFALHEKQLARAASDTAEEKKARAELLVEMAKLAAERLDRGAQAVVLYKEALDLDPEAPGAFEALERQAEREKDFTTLADALERRVERVADPAVRLALLQKLGTVYAERLKEPQKTVHAWTRVLELSPGHQRALRVLRDAYVAAGELDALETLYTSQNDAEGLADFLSGSADRTADPAQKIALSFRAAAVYEEKLGAPERAQRSYERVLSADENNVEAARKLTPIYEKEEKWARLPALYEVRLRASEDDGDRLAILAKLTQVTGGPLANKAAALEWARKAYELDPSESTLDQLEAAARGAATWAPFVEALEARLKKKKGLNQALRRTLRLKLADVYARELDRVDQAVASYRDLVEADPSDTETVRVLDALLRSTGRKDDLRWLFQVRADQVEGDARADVLAEWAALEEDVFGDAERATDLYRRVLELAPERTAALRARARLLLSRGEHAEAAAVIERHRDLSEGDDRASRELELARLYLDHLSRPADALGSARRVLEERPHAADAVAVLERLLDHPDTRPDAAATLEREYASIGDGRRQAAAIRALIETEADPARRRELHVSLADVEEQKLSAPGTAFDVVLRALNEFPADLELWERASVLAERSGRPTDLAEAYRTHLVATLADRGEPADEDTSVASRRIPADVELVLGERAAALHDESLGDPEGAMPYLERVLAVDPTNQRAFARLKQILTGSERWAELEGLYDRAAENATDDASKVELLHEVAVIAEDVIGDAGRAIGYYERIVEIDATHVPALDALEKLYEGEERWDDLADLLEQRLATASDEDAQDIRLYLGRIYLDRLHKPEQAIGHVEEILRQKVEDDDARELAERLLEVGSQRGRSARILEEVYLARDQVRNLVRVLEVRRELSQDEAEQRELIRRVAELRDERLHDDAGSLAALSTLVPLDPEDVPARTRLLEIGRRLGEHDKVAAVLGTAAEKAVAPTTRAEILMALAALHEGVLGDVGAAEAVYRRVTEIDPRDPAIVIPAAEALARILAAAGRTKDLVQVIELQAALEDDVEKRRSLQERAGELYEDALGDPSHAATVWKNRLVDDPVDVRALAALERLYEKQEAWRDLVETLRARERAEEDESARRRAMTRAAEVLADRIGDLPEAIGAWRAVLDAFGPERPTLAALMKLYERAERWPDLAETLEVDLSLVEDSDARAGLLTRLGDVRRLHLGEPASALESYREALALDPKLPAARAALTAMLETPEVRREAAQVLQPLHEADVDADALLHVLEIQIEDADDPADRLELLDRARATAEGTKNDPERAFGIATRGAEQAVGEPSIGAWVDTVERLAATTSKWSEAVALYQRIAPEVLDGDVQLRLLLRIGDLAATMLADDDLAIASYAKALEARADEPSALVALDKLYAKTSRSADLLEILRRRADAAVGDDEKLAILFRQAELQAGPLADPAGATETYEEVLEAALTGRDGGPHPRVDEAIAALETLYRDAGRHTDRVALAERRLDAGRGKPADLRTHIARIAHADLADHERAFDELEEALREDPTHEGAIAELERYLAEEGEGLEARERRARAAAILEPVYLKRADWTLVQKALEGRLAVSEDPVERRGLLGRLATLHEEQREDYQAALGTVAKLLHEDIADESTWAELERLSRVAGAEKRLAAIYAEELSAIDSDDPSTARLARRTGELFAQHDDADAALRWYRRAFAFEPESRELFDRIDALLAKEKRHEERAAHHRAAIDDRDGAERVETLLVVADLERVELGRKDDAVETLRAALDVDESHRGTLDRLQELLAELGRHRELADLFDRRAGLEPTAEAAAVHRLALARLQRDRLDDKAAAVGQLEIIVGELPTHREAIADLEALSADPELKAQIVEILRPLYERSDDWRLLVKLNEDRIGLAEHPQDKVAILCETAELWELRGEDPDRAFAALQEALTLDPEDGEVRSRLERLAPRVGKGQDGAGWPAFAASLHAAVEACGDDLVQRELLATLVRIHDERLDDPRGALSAARRLSALEPTDVGPLERMDTLGVLLGDWSVVVESLGRRAEMASDLDAADLHRRIARTRLDMLDDAEGATASYERALELDPDHAATVDALIELLEEQADTRGERLVELYARRLELATDDETDLRYDLPRRAADRLELLGRPRDAIASLQQALEARPADATVLGRLEVLFRAEAMWDDLLENLKLQATRTDDRARRVELRLALGELQATKLDDPSSALEQYRLVLVEDPTERRAASALRAIAEQREELRLEATEVLLPVVTGEGRHEDRVALLELRLSSLTDPTDRAQVLRTMATVLDADLARPADAEAALLRALEETPDDASVHDAIVAVAAKGGDFGRYADALQSRAAASLDAVVARDLHVRHGKIAEERLEDPRRAVNAYVKAVDQAGDEPDLLEALDRLYARLEDHEALADVLERRVAVAPDDARADLLHRRARLQIDRFRDEEAALATLRQALEHDPAHPASRASLEGLLGSPALFDQVAETLESVYRQRGDHEALAGIYRRKVEHAPPGVERLRARLDLARVLEEQASDPKAALAAVLEAVAEDPSDTEALSVAERLAGATGSFEALATALEASIRARKDDIGPETARELWIRAAEWRRDQASDPAGAEAAYREALALDTGNDVVLRAIVDLQRAAGRERDLVASLRALASLEGPQAAADLRREAKALAEGPLADRALVEEILREMLATDESDAWALAELTRVREAEGDHAEVLKLLTRRADIEASGDEVRRLRHQAAEVARDKLDDASAAIGLYEHIFEDQPSDERASTALRELYEKTGRSTDLLKLLERLVDLADTPAARSTLRVDAARISDTIGSDSQAIDLLRAVLDEEPAHEAASLHLSRMLEKTGRDDDLAELLAKQIDLAASRGDAGAELRFRVRLGEVQETRLGSVDKAIETHQAILERDPDHQGALLALARLQEGRGERGEAAKALERLLTRAEGDEAVALALRLADVFAAIGDAGGDGAEGGLGGQRRALERGLEVRRTSPELRDRLRSVYEKQEAWSELADLVAEDARAAADVPAKVRQLRAAADIHLTRRKDPGAAASLLAEASELAPQDRELLLALCDAYSASGRGKDAVMVLQKIVDSYGGRRSKDLAVIHHRIARAHVADGEREKALAELDVAFKIDPGSIAVLRDLGVLALELADAATDDKAREQYVDRASKTFLALLLQKLDANSPITKAEVFYYLGDVSHRQGDTKKAIQMLERALDNDKGMERARLLLTKLKG